MTTTRSLLPEAVSAGWISSKRHFLKSFLLIFLSFFACLLVKFSWSLGRMSKPFFFASRIDCLSSFIESGWQTMRLLPTLRAEALPL